MTDEMGAGRFWQAQGMRAMGAAIVTAAGPERPAGFLALSVAHFSADPPVMTVAVSPSTSALAAIRSSGTFAINWLAGDAAEVLARFTGKDAPKGADRFSGLALDAFASGTPILPGIAGAMDCRVEDEVERFGTVLLFGRLAAVAPASGQGALVYFGGKTRQVE